MPTANIESFIRGVPTRELVDYEVTGPATNAEGKLVASLKVDLQRFNAYLRGARDAVRFLSGA